MHWLALVLLAALTGDTGPAETPMPKSLVPALPPPSLFARGPATPEQTPDGVLAVLPATSVLVARIGPDGMVSLACVDSEPAARRFLEAPVESLPTAGRAREK